MEGTIRSLVLDRGFGFIRVSGQADVFFHLSDLVELVFDERLQEQRVEFEVQSSDKGFRAVNVRPADA